ncbi:MAG TPA: hypothetical protein VH022_10325 [Candidatus Acidoferrum sp.]|nr:hypothetical protein [Candidatus Acidoferrum sp.]
MISVTNLKRQLAAGCILMSCPVFAGSKPANEVVKGWLSDSNCAKERAKGGAYTATNADCAKECVAQGKKIVLIDPDHKKVVDIANQDAVKNNVGDYVELAGSTDAKNVLHVDSLKFLDKNRAMCGVPEKKPAAKE